MPPFVECPQAPQDLWLKGMVSWLIRLFKVSVMKLGVLSWGAGWEARGSGCVHMSRHFHLQRMDNLEQTSQSLSEFICNTGQ